MCFKKIITLSLIVYFFISLSTELKADSYTLFKDSTPPKVYFFLATTCPISQQYTKEIKRLDSLYRIQHIEMILVFPTDGKKSIKKEVNRFVSKYGLTLHVLIDKKFMLTEELNATVTPEVFLVGENNTILYHGAIDNWYYALGKNRLEITSHYLEDAIYATRNNMPIYSPYVAPVGCFIETK